MTVRRACIFDFDGVLIESEYAGNRQIADYLTGIGHPTTPEESMANFMGLAGRRFPRARSSAGSAAPLPDDFHAAREAEDRARDGGGRSTAVAGAVAFVRALPRRPAARDRLVELDRTGSPRISSISASRDAFGDHDLFAAASMSTRGKPAPDLYLHAAARARRRHRALRDPRGFARRRHRRGRVGRAMSSACARAAHCALGPCRSPARARASTTIAHDFDEVAAADSPERSRHAPRRHVPDSRAGARCGRAWSRDSARCAGWAAGCAARARPPSMPAASSAATLSGLLVSSRTRSWPSSVEHPRRDARNRAHRPRSPAAYWRRPCRTPGPAAHRRAAC